MSVYPAADHMTTDLVGNGTDFAALDEDALARFRHNAVGVVFQDLHLVPTMTALENVAIPLELARRADATAWMPWGSAIG